MNRPRSETEQVKAPVPVSSGMAPVNSPCSSAWARERDPASFGVCPLHDPALVNCLCWGAVTKGSSNTGERQNHLPQIFELKVLPWPCSLRCAHILVACATISCSGEKPQCRTQSDLWDVTTNMGNDGQQNFPSCFWLRDPAHLRVSKHPSNTARSRLRWGSSSQERLISLLHRVFPVTAHLCPQL